MGLIFVAVFVALGFYFLLAFNGLVRRRNLVKNSFSQIDVQLRRRYDLIPNLVESAKAYMKHETATLQAVIEARNAALASAGRGSAGASQELIGAEAVLGQTMTRFMAVAEAYPDLKANQNMLSLMEELTSTENKISYARQAYNDSVMDYNNARESFPNSLVASGWGFAEIPMWEEANSAVREPVKVSFN